MQNFTVADLVQTTLATFAFALFLLPPGYLLGMASNAFCMRRRSGAEKILFSSAFSIATAPILAVLLTRISSYRVTIAIFLMLAAISVAMLWRQLPWTSGVRRSTWISLGMVAGWFVLVQLSLADLQVGHRLYVSFVAFDHSVRIPFVEAAARSGVPPLNPFYGLGKIPILRYYYYWYVVCALPMRLFGLSAKACLNASVVWSGLGLASTIPLFLKYVLDEREHLRAKSVIGIALLGVTGLDLIPYAAVTISSRAWLADMEWWDPNQVTSWLGSLLWVPHHVASLTACMSGLLVLSAIDEESSIRQRVWATVISALAFASAAGLSVYVTFVFAVFGTLWALSSLARKRMKTVATYAITAVLSLALSLPFVLDLLQGHSGTGLGHAGNGERFAFFALRGASDISEFLGDLGIHNSLLLHLASLPVLLVMYALEFGFFALILVLDLRGRQAGRKRPMLWVMFAVCLTMMSVLKSDATNVNDLGIRGMLVGQFALLILAAPIVHAVFFRGNTAVQAGLRARWIKYSLLFTLVLGVAGTAFQLFALRAYAPLADAGILGRSDRFLGPPGFGERTYWMREGYLSLDRLTPPTAFVQYNPVRDDALIAHLYSTHQAVMGDSSCGSAFGGDIAACKKAISRFDTLFNSPDSLRSLKLDEFCDEFHVAVLVATDADPVWQDRTSWVWVRPNLLNDNPSMRAIACGGGLRVAAMR